jgi:putative transposase
MDKMLQSHELYKSLGSQASQKLLFQLDKAWKSFFVTIKDWSKYPSKYLGRPKLPNYKKKDGRNIVALKNIQVMIKEGYIYFAWCRLKPFNNLIKTNIKGKLLQMRFVPRNNIYIMEIVYEVEIPDIQDAEPKNICGIDIGINNFATLVNNVGTLPIIINGKIIKSINQFYNKELAHYKSVLKKTNKKDYSNRLNRITLKRNNKIKNYMHKASKQVIEYCRALNLDTIVIGNNPEWKQSSNLNEKVNQAFVQIPFENFINMVKYKAEDVGIRLVITEESYTSGTSFLDNELPNKNNYNKSRRIKRGLFRSDTNQLINSDVNGALQIIKKVIPNAFENGIEGIDFCPIVLNV